MKLNEDLFEFEIPIVNTQNELTVDEIEDNIVATPEENGVATILMNSISDTWDNIQQYNNAIATIADTNIENSDKIITILQDIVNDENKNAGRLVAALGAITSDVDNIDVGEEEAEMKLTETINPEADNVRKIISAMDWNKPTFMDRTKNGYRLKWGGHNFLKNTTPEQANNILKEIEDKTKIKCFLNKNGFLIVPYSKQIGECLKEDLDTDNKIKLLSDILGRSISTSDENYIYDGWRAFYNDPEMFRDTVVVDLVNHGLDTRPVKESKQKMNIKESLDFHDQTDLRFYMYQAVKNAINTFGDQLEKSDVQDAVDYAMENFDYLTSFNKMDDEEENESLKEELRDATEDEYFDMRNDMYNALADVAFKYSQKGIEFTAKQWDDAYNWWGDRFFIADFHESLHEDIENLEDVDVEFNPVMQHAKEQSEKVSKEIDKEMKDIQKGIPEWDSEKVIGANKQEVPKKPEEPKLTLDESLFR